LASSSVESAFVAIVGLLWPTAAAGFDEFIFGRIGRPRSRACSRQHRRRQAISSSLAAADVQAGVEAVHTGNRRERSAVLLRPLMTAWTPSRGLKDSLADLRKFPEMEFEDEGRRYWMIAFYPAVLPAADAGGQREALSGVRFYGGCSGLNAAVLASQPSLVLNVQATV
jgi:hypothetical protein